MSRFVIEIFREPDQQFISLQNPGGFIFQFNEAIGLSMGQVLSTPMIVTGLFLIFWSRVLKTSELK